MKFVNWVMCFVIALNLLVGALTFSTLISFHAEAVHDRTNMIRTLNEFSARKLDTAEANQRNEMTMKQLNDVYDLTTEIRHRQVINEANIEINHRLLQIRATTQPTSEQTTLPTDVPLPQREH